MRIAAVVAAFVLVFVAALVSVVAPAAGQTVPPIPTYELETPVTPYPTATPRPDCNEWCAPMPPTPATAAPDSPPLEPTAEVGAAFPGMPMYVDYLVFCPTVGRTR